MSGLQVIHEKDPLYKTQAGDLIPQRTTKAQMDRMFEDGVPRFLTQEDKGRWTVDEDPMRAVDDRPVPQAFFNRAKMPCSGLAGSTR